MAYNGYLIKVRNGAGAYSVPPMKYVVEQSYKATPNQRTDLDSGMTSTDGILHRSVLQHTRTKIEFESLPLDNTEADELTGFFRSRWVNQRERDVYLEYYDSETNSYKQGHFYMPDVDYVIKTVDNAKNKIFYQPLRLAFIEY